MLTKEKLNVYKKYDGQNDLFALSARKKEKSIINDSDWNLIDSFVQDIKLIAKNQAANSYKEDIERKLLESCDNEETIELLTTYAKTNNSNKESFLKKLSKLFKR